MSRARAAAGVPRLLAVTVLAVCLALSPVPPSAAADGTGTGPAAAARPASGTAPGASGPLRWRTCARPDAVPGAQCATLRVPLDWSRPGGRTIALALARLPAKDPDRRIGPLLYNGGGPGGSGVADVADGDPLFDHPELAALRERFDLIGFDPRGVGDSTPVRCGRPAPHASDVSRFPRTDAGYERLRAHNRAAGAACRAATGPLLEHVDTGSVVRDMEALRAALGTPRVSFLGLSYGTEIGALYAERHPERVRAMVLDGAVDHSLPARRAALDEARATEAAFGRFTAWCRTERGCALHGEDVTGLHERVMAAAGRKPLPAPGAGGPATAEELASGAYTLLTLRSTWPALAEALAAADGSGGRRPDGTALAEAAAYRQPAYPVYRAVGCHDFAPRTRGPADLRAQAGRLRAAAPHTWRYSEFWDWTSGCLGWPVPAANPPRPHPVSGTPPVLVVNTTGDPATPYRWAERLAASMERGRLLPVLGDGHTGILHSACARAHEARYLVTATPPARGTACRSDPVPRPAPEHP